MLQKLLQLCDQKANENGWGDRQGRYYARLVVPAELRPIIGKRELLEPLGADRSLALRKHALARMHERWTPRATNPNQLAKPAG